MSSSADIAEEQIWRQIYENYVDKLSRLVGRLGIYGSDRDDLVQQAFELAFARVHEGLPLSEVGPWLHGTIGNLVRTHRRWQRVRRFHASAVKTFFELNEGPASPPAHIARNETRSHIEHTMDRLSPKLRDVLVLIDAEELSLDEAAVVLGIPVNTVRSRLRLAREQFRALWGTSDERVGALT